MDPISAEAIASASPAEVGGLDKGAGAQQPGGTSFREVMESAKPPDGADPLQAGRVEAAPRIEAAAEAQRAEPAMKRLDDFFQSVANDEKAMDRAMRRAMRGDAMDGGELLRLQAVMYGYAQKIDLSTKIVEKTTGGLKQMMNTQV